MRKLNPKELDWSKDRDRHWFYGPFYPNETCKNGKCPANSLQSLFIPPKEASRLKPAIKRKLHPKDYINNIKPDTPLRRSCSDSALADSRLDRTFVKDIQQSPSTPRDIVIQFFEEETGHTSPNLCNGKRINFNPVVEERVFDSNSGMPIIPVISDIASGSTSFKNSHDLDEEGTIVTILSKGLPILPKETLDRIIIPPILEPVNLKAPNMKKVKVIPEECKTYFKLPEERVSKYLSNWQKDSNYHTDTDYLDYPPEEISDDITDDVVLPSQNAVSDSYGITDCISDSIVNTVKLSSFLWNSAKTLSLW